MLSSLRSALSRPPVNWTGRPAQIPGLVSPRFRSTMSDKTQLARLPLHTSGPLECAIKGTVLLQHPYFNKGSAFTAREREDFDLTGLLPQRIQTLEQQVDRAYQQYSSMPDDLSKNTFLTSMKEQNEVLYFKVSLRHEASDMMYRSPELGVQLHRSEQVVTHAERFFPAPEARRIMQKYEEPCGRRLTRGSS